MFRTLLRALIGSRVARIGAWGATQCIFFVLTISAQEVKGIATSATICSRLIVMATAPRRLEGASRPPHSALDQHHLYNIPSKRG